MYNANQQRVINNGFASPTQEHAAVNPKFSDDCARLTFAIQQSLPESVRRIVRDFWEKTLMGSEFHQAFVLNAAIHHALPPMTRRAVRDFGRKMVLDSKQELIQHFSSADIDDVADHILNEASNSFLDRCLEKRLLTIEARPLINALAKAERLGYEPGDMHMLDNDKERVIPQEAYPGAALAANGVPHVAPHVAPHAAPHAVPPGYPTAPQLQCMRCYRTFAYPSAYEYHMQENVCSKPPPTNKGFEYSCQHCGEGCISWPELQFHYNRKFCGDFTPKVPDPPPQARGPGRPPRNPLPPQTSQVAILPSTQPPPTNGHKHVSVQTPTAPVAQPPPPPSSTASPSGTDPYAHLSPSQLSAMNEELKAAEVKYAPRFAEAEAIADENERRAKIEGLRNSFGTKQSMIRKKYGVRLRERRTKAEIQAERERLGLKRAEREKARGGVDDHDSSPAASRATPGRPAGSGSGWTAANLSSAGRTPSVWEAHDAKRRRLEGSEGSRGVEHIRSGDGLDETPTRKTLSVLQMGGGLSGSPATAATQDPTRPAPPPRPRSAPLSSGTSPPPSIETLRKGLGNKPGGGEASPTPSSARDREDVSMEDAPRHGTGTTDKPSPLSVDSDDGSDDDDDDDIPSTLPPHVRQSLSGTFS
ncbi:hypothetical protein QBC46DRAFT_264623 [Diplogelasinospora grovesii]|uniref:Uncharacterized protein n=1 Tax=Diplogelasinospora grovesii TaxID=303347 RepID=A0AAN6N421_9PEZI|nr:hypothetical protein QBC46DRAFT_264623 [Diplogelasinospora grovesii]